MRYCELMNEKKINLKKLSKLLILIWTGSLLVIMVPEMWSDGQIWLEAVNAGNARAGLFSFITSEYSVSYWKFIVLLLAGWLLLKYGPKVWVEFKGWLYS